MSRTRQEQRERTRQTLLEATMQCLVTFGHAGTTTQRIQDEAGISRGALLHHFASKSELLVAATHHIAELRLARIRGLVDSLGDDTDALGHMVYAIRDAMAGPAFQAAIELWTASRTDPQLREALLPAERRLGAALHEVFNEHAGITDPEISRTAFESLMALVRGLELTRILRTDASSEARVLNDWLERIEQLRSRR